MTDQQKRAAVIAMYPNSKSWKKKVQKMGDGQVFAIWAKAQQKKEQQNKPVKDDQDDIPF